MRGTINLRKKCYRTSKAGARNKSINNFRALREKLVYALIASAVCELIVEPDEKQYSEPRVVLALEIL